MQSMICCFCDKFCRNIWFDVIIWLLDNEAEYQAEAHNLLVFVSLVFADKLMEKLY